MDRPWEAIVPRRGAWAQATAAGSGHRYLIEKQLKPVKLCVSRACISPGPGTCCPYSLWILDNWRPKMKRGWTRLSDQLRGQSHCAGVSGPGTAPWGQMPCCFQAPGWSGSCIMTLGPRALLSCLSRGREDLVVLLGPLPGPICPHTPGAQACATQPEPGPCTAGGVPCFRNPGCLLPGPLLSPEENRHPRLLQEPALGRGEGSALLPKFLAHLPGVGWQMEADVLNKLGPDHF